MTSTDGVVIDERLLIRSDASGPRSARMVLQNPRVDFAVFEVARGGILREGLGYERNDVAVVLNVLGPKILGDATNIIVDGVITGRGIDFPSLQIVLGGVLVLYVFASVFSFLQGYVLNGVTQRIVYSLREEVEAKINRLPLTYFDKVQRGEVLSRVTNDIDNISQSLQQTMSQMLTS
eukprot:gene21281-26076_t